MAFPTFCWGQEVLVGSPVLTPVCNWLDFIVTDKTLAHRLLKGPLFVNYKGATRFISFIMRPYFFELPS